MTLEDSLRSSLRPSPARTPGIFLREVGGAPAHPVDFFVFQDVFEELSFAATYRPEPCVAVLTGGFGLEEGRGFVEITGFMGLTYLKTDPEGGDAPSGDLYEVLRPLCDEWLAEHGGGEVIVGLFVGAPGSGASLHREVVRAHLSLFNIPFEPVLVIDAEERKVALYARPPGGRFSDSPFALAIARGRPGEPADDTEESPEEASEERPAEGPAEGPAGAGG